MELARESAGRGSRYGQYTLGVLHHQGKGGLACDRAQALEFYRLAAAQGLHAAQLSLGSMYGFGYGVARNEAEALRLYQLAAAQGNPAALYQVAMSYEIGTGVCENKAEAICWYRRAQTAGFQGAADDLKRLRW